MTPGKLRNLLQVYLPLPATSDSRGNTIINFADEPDFPTYGSLTPLVGGELLYAKQIRADMRYKVTMRYNSKVTHMAKIVWNDGNKLRTFHAGPVLNIDMANFEMSLYAFEIL